MRQMAHETVDPDEDLQVCDREGRGDEPWHAFFFGHFARESFAGESNQRCRSNCEADVETCAESDKKPLTLEMEDGSCEWTDGDQTVQEQQRPGEPFSQSGFDCTAPISQAPA